MTLEPVTYWAPGALGDDNERAMVAPILIRGRWTEERTELQGSGGEQIISKTMVIVDRDVEEGGFLARGDHTGIPNPNNYDAAEEIRGFTSTPDLRFMEQVKRAYL